MIADTVAAATLPLVKIAEAAATAAELAAEAYEHVPDDLRDELRAAATLAIAAAEIAADLTHGNSAPQTDHPLIVRAAAALLTARTAARE
ncbi:MAG: hypothetical protein EXQ77_02745 [Thermoleophilia bacterium]|nr:hypothetical protein [Thermoleophilia bacterium]